jgi:hypothetical protein
MSNGWLKRSLSALEDQTKGWPDWKREAASAEPQLAIPQPESQSPGKTEANATAVATRDDAVLGG